MSDGDEIHESREAVSGRELPESLPEESQETRAHSKQETKNAQRTGSTSTSRRSLTLHQRFLKISKQTSYLVVTSCTCVLAMLAIASIVVSSLALSVSVQWTTSALESMDSYCRSASLGSGCLAVDPLATIPWPGFVAWSIALALCMLLALHGAHRCFFPPLIPDLR